MAKEILAVPEEYLPAVIAVIRNGLAVTSVPKEVKENLLKWCKEEEKYMKG